MNYPPIVILHGWNLSAKYYQLLGRRLKESGFDVFIPDFPGFGDNKTLTKPLFLKDYEDFLMEYLKKNKIIKPIIIGHSFGGRVALKAAAHYKEKFKVLILTGVPGFQPVSSLKVKIFLIIAKVGKYIFSMPILSLFKDLFRKILYHISGSGDYYRASGFLKATFQNIIKEEPEQYMSKLNLPVLLIWGKEDKIVPVNIAYKMQEAITNSQLEIIEKAGHRVPYEDELIFTRNIIKFIKNQ